MSASFVYFRFLAFVGSAGLDHCTQRPHQTSLSWFLYNRGPNKSQDLDIKTTLVSGCRCREPQRCPFSVCWTENAQKRLGIYSLTTTRHKLQLSQCRARHHSPGRDLSVTAVGH